MASTNAQFSLQDRDDLGWKLFELRHKNLLSISKAQKVHLTTLLVQIALFWVWYISGAKDATVQGVVLSGRGIWLAMPVLLSLFCLAFIGSVNAALPAKKALEEVAERLGIHGATRFGFAFYDLDTDKNILDYLTFLKLSLSNNDFAQSNRYDPRQFLYPAVIIVSIATTAFALNGVRGWRLDFYVLVCAGMQLVFSLRPISRAFQRFFGNDIDNGL